ncbi:response regulator transcription factor [Caldimonas brevitalea]|uniref:Two-component response regulator n=1 Tax=Caldimonas brevitalea TaxID=413882 RepID=A0A0G3BS29_9BURK|nr:response regulator [Caldimonas brevitalea]AKJ29310.1 two-component response regulator [Caldimonas brevitalea]
MKVKMLTMMSRTGECWRVGPDTSQPLIYIVDDDVSLCTALGRLMWIQGYSAAVFHCAEAFLAQHDPDAHGCIILDMVLPGLDGLSLQQALSQRDNGMPIIFLTGQADVAMCVRAMKDGAFDFLTKPFDDTVLLASVQRAVEMDALHRRTRAKRAAAESRLATLTPREREVLTHVVAGRLNKQIAADLGTCEKTIKVHRARGIRKMCVRSVAELVRVLDATCIRSQDEGH